MNTFQAGPVDTAKLGTDADKGACHPTEPDGPLTIANCAKSGVVIMEFEIAELIEVANPATLATATEAHDAAIVDRATGSSHWGTTDSAISVSSEGHRICGQDNEIAGHTFGVMNFGAQG